MWPRSGRVRALSWADGRRPPLFRQTRRKRLSRRVNRMQSTRGPLGAEAHTQTAASHKASGDNPEERGLPLTREGLAGLYRAPLSSPATGRQVTLTFPCPHSMCLGFREVTGCPKSCLCDSIIPCKTSRRSLIDSTALGDVTPSAICTVSWEGLAFATRTPQGPDTTLS